MCVKSRYKHASHQPCHHMVLLWSDAFTPPTFGWFGRFTDDIQPICISKIKWTLGCGSMNYSLGVIVLLSPRFHLCGHISHHCPWICLLQNSITLVKAKSSHIWTIIFYGRLHPHGHWDLPLSQPGVLVLESALVIYDYARIYVKKCYSCLYILDLFALVHHIHCILVVYSGYFTVLCLFLRLLLLCPLIVILMVVLTCKTLFPLIILLPNLQAHQCWMEVDLTIIATPINPSTPATPMPSNSE